MGKTVKIIKVFFCFALAVFLLECNKGEELRGIYKAEGMYNDSLEFSSNSRVIMNFDNEKLEGTYKITDKTILITVKNSMRLVVLTLVDKNTIVRRYYGAQVFFKK
jgi:hypothetical protein